MQGMYVRTDVKIDISISTRTMTTKFGKQLHVKDLTEMRLINQLLVTTLRYDHVTNYKHCICTTRVPIATKLGSMVIYLDEPLPMKSHEPLIMWSCETT